LNGKLDPLSVLCITESEQLRQSNQERAVRLSLITLLFVGFAVSNCAQEKVESSAVTFRLGPAGIEESKLRIEGLTVSCKSTRDKSAVFLLVANESDEKVSCDFTCDFGDSDAGEEVFTLQCEDVPVSANSPSTAYCRRSVGDLKQGLGSISRFDAICN
jgi:hypothetical protein